MQVASIQVHDIYHLNASISTSLKFSGTLTTPNLPLYFPIFSRVFFHKMHSGKLVILSLILLAKFCSAHVRLDFPAARDFALDFLDNVRTPAPCGMPKGKVKTSLLAGTTTNITWHLAYPHQGKQTMYQNSNNDNNYFLKCLTVH